MFCEKCGAQLEDGAPLCPQCGRPSAASGQAAAATPPKKKKKALKIWLFILAGLIAFGAAGYFGAAAWMRARDYKDAVALMDAGDYAYASDLFTALGNYKDSAALAAACNNERDYQQAADAYGEGLYFTAYRGFSALGSYKDSATRMAACIQPDPASGVLYFNAAYASSAVSFTVSTGNNSGYDTYLKFYTSAGNLVACVFVPPNANATFQLQAGSYKINKAMGVNWFGTQEMFGESGHYAKVLFENDTTDTVTLQDNYMYTLTFDVTDASGDDIGDENIDRTDF